MKNVFGAILSLVVITLFIACGPGGGDLSIMEAERLFIDENAADTEFQVPTNTVVVFNFSANLTTGHGWKFVSGNKVFKLLYDEYVPENSLLGSSGTQLFYVAGVTNGYAPIQFSFHNPAGEVLHAKIFNAYSKGTFNERVKIPEKQVRVSEYSAPNLNVPTSFDWCKQGVCPSIRNQGSCGSCWAFATVGSFEVNIARTGGNVPNLSEQYLISCNSDGWGCNGGWFAHAYHINKKVSEEIEAGAVLESVRPYTGTYAQCNPPHPKAYKGSNWNYVTDKSGTPTVAQMKQAIYDHGPVSVAVYVDSAFQSYSGGIFYGSGAGQVNHAVVLTGWDGDVFKLRNSWGASWGESGYMNIHYSANSIGYSAAYINYSGGPAPTPTPAPEPIPTPDPSPNSCVGYCGKKALDGCWCDDLCVQYNDCCTDKQEICNSPQPTPTPGPSPNSCLDYCGKKAPGGCWCDIWCIYFNDCCSDKKQICG